MALVADRIQNAATAKQATRQKAEGEKRSTSNRERYRGCGDRGAGDEDGRVLKVEEDDRESLDRTLSLEDERNEEVRVHVCLLHVYVTTGACITFIRYGYMATFFSILMLQVFHGM